MIGIFNLNIGNNAPKLKKREVSGEGVTFDENGNVSGCEANFNVTEDYE